MGRITVQELFRKADPERVTEAYFIMDTIFYPYEKYSIDQKVDIILKIRKSIADHIDRFKNCDISTENAQTIFITELPCESYSEKGQTEIYLFSVYDEAAKEKVQHEVTHLSGNDEVRLDQYGIDMCELNDVAGYYVSEQSIAELGVTACCAEILIEFFQMGYSDEARKKSRECIEERLAEAEKDICEEKFTSFEELFANIRQSILDECEDEDERQHMLYENEYEDKVKEIEDRYSHRIMDENHKKLTDLLQQEFTDPQIFKSNAEI